MRRVKLGFASLQRFWALVVLDKDAKDVIACTNCLMCKEGISGCSYNGEYKNKIRCNRQF